MADKVLFSSQMCANYLKRLTKMSLYPAVSDEKSKFALNFFAATISAKLALMKIV